MLRFQRSLTMHAAGVAVARLAVLAALSTPTFAQTRLTHNGVTWTFAGEHETGRFVNGEYWIVGPVEIVNITNDRNDPSFTPKRGQNGSMVNPDGGPHQGYDSGLASYRESLNAALPDGKPVSADNPLLLRPNETLISMVSWLYRSADDREPGCPPVSSTPGAPRPATRSAALLTCLDAPPAAGSFRPPYCGSDKTVRFNQADLRLRRLKKLAPVQPMPDVRRIEQAMSRTWVDHVHEWAGAFLHPSEHMPNYGRDMGHIMIQAALLVHVDFDQLPGKPGKERLLVNLVQYGIDLAGIADAGGGWPENGGHGMGRKWPILFAGLMLDDEHMKGVGQWDTAFQEDEQTFYVSQREVDITHSDAWKPDRRAPTLPYEAEHIGMPEWGIRHTRVPEADNRHWAATYRDINNSVLPGFVLAALLMDQKAAWSHDALFDYADRVMARIDEDTAARVSNLPPPFVTAMWKAYR